MNIVAAKLGSPNVTGIAAIAVAGTVVLAALASSTRENRGSSDDGESKESKAREVHVGNES